MKLVRYLEAGVATAGVVVEDSIVALSDVAPGLTQIRQLAAEGLAAVAPIENRLRNAMPRIALADANLLAPIERPGKFLGIGMNYRRHAEEGTRLGLPPVKGQMWFTKHSSSISGPFDPVDPGVTRRLDYEVELGVVIGPSARYVTEKEAPAHAFGYFVANDFSARDWQGHSPTMMIGKSFDTFGPIGPWIVTADEIGDPHRLGIRCFVNGELRQNSNTDELIFSVWQQITYLSKAFTLEAGDLLMTGTPSGVGVALDPPQFLGTGDVVRCEIDSIGAIENRILTPHARLA